MDLSVLLPIYNEEENLPPVLEELHGVLSTMGKSFEIIAVDDGSKDKSVEVLKGLRSRFPELKVIAFRKNAGQTAAFAAGFHHATGTVIVTMDSDGQNDPRDIPRMVAVLEQGHDFVAGRRANRKDAMMLRKIPSKIANFIIRRVTKTKIRDLGCSLKVYRKEITDDLRLYGEMHRFLAVLIEGLGARIAEIDVNHRARTMGVSKYGISRTFKVVLDLLTVWFMQGFQTKPLYLFGFASIALFLMSALISAFVLYEKYALDIFVHRNPLFMIAVFFALVATQFLGLGLLAEMLSRTYYESQSKATYFIKEKIGLGSK